jgi:hypothetical protein
MLKQYFTLIFFSFILLFTACKKSDDGGGGGGGTTPATIASVTVPTGATLTGPKNTVITITGTNFLTDLSKIEVKVNGKSCAVLSATATTITAKIPPACGTGLVELYLNGTKYTGPVFTFIDSYTLSSVTNGTVGYQDGPVATAKYEQIVGLTIDASDNIYSAQYNTPRIRKLTASGTVSTLAGNGVSGDVNGNGTAAQFFGMDFIASDAAGNVYVADQQPAGNKIKKVDLSGNVTSLISVPYQIQAIKVGKTSGALYISGPADIAKYNASTGALIWRLTTHGSGSLDGDTSIVKFYLYGGIEVDDAENNIYVSDWTLSASHGARLKKLNLTNKTMTTIAGDGTDGDVVNSDPLTSKIRLISCSVLDQKGGIYFASSYNNKVYYLKDNVLKVVVDGVYSTTLDVDGDFSVGRLTYPHGLVIDSKGQLFIGCVGNNKIKKLVID